MPALTGLLDGGIPGLRGAAASGLVSRLSQSEGMLGHLANSELVSRVTQTGKHAHDAKTVLANADKVMEVGNGAATSWDELGELALGPAARGQRLLIIGGGPSGNDVAIRAAKAGWQDIVVLEKYGKNPIRHTQFNLAPSVADSQAQLGGDRLLDNYSTIVKRFKDDSVHGEMHVDNEGDHIITDLGAQTDADALIRGFDGVDRRPWSRISVQGVEATQRRYIDQVINAGPEGPKIKYLYGNAVTRAEDGVDGIRLFAQEKDGTEHAIDGAFAVSATGGRNPFGVKRVLFPEKAHFVGGLTEPTKPKYILHPRMTRDGSELSFASQVANPGGRPYATVGLPWDKTHGLVWAQVEKPAKEYTTQQLRAVMEDRIKITGHHGALLQGDEALLPVDVQLGMVPDDVKVTGNRWLLAGDELLVPYFPTSTGAGHALGVNGPLVGDHLGPLREAIQRGDQGAVQGILDHYGPAAKAEARKVEEVGRHQMLEDTGLVERPFEESWQEAQAAARAHDPSATATLGNAP